MKTTDEFLPEGDLNGDFDRLLCRAMRERPEFEPLPDLALRAARLGREQERAELQIALKQRLAQWERRKWWQRSASAVAAAFSIK